MSNNIYRKKKLKNQPIFYKTIRIDYKTNNSICLHIRNINAQMEETANQRLTICLIDLVLRSTSVTRVNFTITPTYYI